MGESDPSRMPALTDQRDRTIQTLIDHFAADRLTVDEFERRLDAAHRALEAAQLRALTADLPAVPAATPAVSQPVPRLAPPGSVRDHQFMAAVMGGVERKGGWSPARRTLIFAFMGGAELDFRETLMPEGITEVQIVAIWGGVEIIVPPGMNVDCSGTAIMGGFEHAPGPAVVDPTAPTLRITGLAFMGGVDVQTRYPGESARDARNRERAERRRLRKEQKRLRGGP